MPFDSKHVSQQSGAAPLAIYVHIPFCAKHCAYCDFNTYVEKAQSDLPRATVDAICRDIELASRQRPAGHEETPPGMRPVPTIFFGGGTPTYLNGEQLGRILTTICNCFDVLPDAEISSEANPGSSDAAKFAAMRAAGFNRLSIGVQSFDNTLLVALDRFHTSDEAENAFRLAREAGFDNLNLDLMFALPKQTPGLWEASLQRALALGVEHLSLYALTLEAGTRFERLHTGGKLDLPDEDEELGMYERSIALLTQAGYEHYEVSNFARPGFRCQHNQVYWRNEEYLGVGPGAVSYLAGRRFKRERLPNRYIHKVNKIDQNKIDQAENQNNAVADLAVESECLLPEETLGETMMLGLRLRDGLPLARLRSRFALDPLLHFAPQIAKLTTRGLLVLDNDTLRLTHHGLLLANNVLSEFLPD